MTDKLPKGFHWLTVTDVRKETEHATSVAFELPDDLKETFAFRPGQYLALMKEIDGEAIRRPYSICVAPGDGELRVCSKHLPGGAMSSFINEQLQVGEKIAVRLPMGRFCLDTDNATSEHFVFIAAGSGVTPVLSHIKHLLTQTDANITFFFGNRARTDIIFRDALLDLKNKYLGRLSVHHVLSRESREAPIFEGRLTEEKVGDLVSTFCDAANVAKFLICGPQEMMENARSALLSLGVEEDHILMESFGSYEKQAPPPLTKSAKTGDAARTKITLFGEETELDVPFDKPIIDIALAAGLDVPFACRGGVCCTCKARLIEGEVAMAVNYGIEPDEIERGFILTCQAHPRSAKLVVDYDAV